jgi:hypothetical protein
MTKKKTTKSKSYPIEYAPNGGGCGRLRAKTKNEMRFFNLRMHVNLALSPTQADLVLAAIKPAPERWPFNVQRPNVGIVTLEALKRIPKKIAWAFFKHGSQTVKLTEMEALALFGRLRTAE